MALSEENGGMTSDKFGSRKHHVEDTQALYTLFYITSSDWEGPHKPEYLWTWYKIMTW